MSENVKKAFEECRKFLDEITPEELEEYERNLNLDYQSYTNGINFTETVLLNKNVSLFAKSEYSTGQRKFESINKSFCSEFDKIVYAA